MNQLIVTGRHRERQTIALNRARMTIGRAQGSDLLLDTPLASRLHALLSVREDGVYVSDLDSSNGTYLNGRKIDRAQLRHRDVIRVGDCDIRYVEHQAEARDPQDVVTVR
ncbi:FHA domain-containing protein [Xenophilus sp. Marseille-Q4582]|uniref:FHA domain-containing protein n=1 Tax=Xenophilus sp. Marseille-Q4582 TaxID=2866600 RepID=UPI001CE47384|nr:FHA domain-containing protein [Xenophilus sp. Marseille-Q4582]